MRATVRSSDDAIAATDALGGATISRRGKTRRRDLHLNDSTTEAIPRERGNRDGEKTEAYGNSVSCEEAHAREISSNLSHSRDYNYPSAIAATAS